jgi:hypothetical protein
MDFAGVIVVGLIINLILSLVVADTAAKKGLSYGAFFWLSFLTSFLIGLLVVIAVPKVEKAPIRTLPLDESPSGNFARNDEGFFAKCPFCAEWVKSEAKVCRFCGRDIEEPIKQLIESDRAAIRATKNEEHAERQARAAQQKAFEEKRVARSRQARVQRRALLRKPSTIITVSTVFILIASVVAISLVNLANDNVAKAVKARQILEAHSDWLALAGNCDSLKREDISYTVSPDNKSLSVKGRDRIDVPWTTCIGQQLAIGAPQTADGETNLQAGLGWKVQAGIGADPNYGTVRALTEKFGNLTVVSSMPWYAYEDFTMVITRD